LIHTPVYYHLIHSLLSKTPASPLPSPAPKKAAAADDWVDPLKMNAKEFEKYLEVMMGFYRGRE
jgi:hypothetical protein